MTNEKRTERKYDLKERTLKLGRNLISICTRVPKSHINNPIVSQLVRSGTSIGANYSEADSASSKKDFINKLTIAHKEISETKYWLSILLEVVPNLEEDLKEVYAEVQELNLIFASIIRKSRENSN